jgi:hypothetical protein
VHPDSLYAAKADEELISLAEQKDSLTETSQLALVAELSRRNLEVPTALPPVVSRPAGAESESDRTTTDVTPSRALWLGLFLLDTFLVYACAIHLSPMLVGRWFAWTLPALGIRGGVTPSDWYLCHLELATIVPAFIAGYIDPGRFLPATIGNQIATWRSGVGCESSLDDPYGCPAVALVSLPCSLVCTVRQLAVSARVLLSYSACHANSFEPAHQRPSAPLGTDVRDRAVLCGRCVQCRCSGVETSAATRALQASFLGCPSAATAPLVARR